MRVPSFRFRPSLAMGALALAATLVAGCAAGTAGDGVASLRSPGTDAEPSPTASSDPQEALLAFARCMREHGVDMPDPQVGSDGLIGLGPVAARRVDERDAEEFGEADKACRHHLDGVALGGPNASPDPELQEKFLAFARCMREQGIDFPDPQFQNGGATVAIGGDGIDPTSPEFQAAQEACGDLLPGRPGAGGVAPAQPGGSNQ